MFRQISTSLNNTQVTKPTSYYPYISYLANLSLSADAKKSWATAAGWELDELTAPGIQGTTGATNSGFKKRGKWIEGSAEFELCDRIHNEAFSVQKLLVPGVRIDVQAYLTKPEFQIVSSVANGTYRVVITKAALLIRRVEVSPQVRLAHASMFERGANAVYLTPRVETRAFEVARGSFSFEIGDVFQASIPTLLTCVFVSSTAQRGAYCENPYFLQHASLKNLELFLGNALKAAPAWRATTWAVLIGSRRIPAGSWELDTANERFLRLYHHTMQ